LYFVLFFSSTNFEGPFSLARCQKHDSVVVENRNVTLLLLGFAFLF